MAVQRARLRRQAQQMRWTRQRSFLNLNHMLVARPIRPIHSPSLGPCPLPPPLLLTVLPSTLIILETATSTAALCIPIRSPATTGRLGGDPRHGSIDLNSDDPFRTTDASWFCLREAP